MTPTSTPLGNRVWMPALAWLFAVGFASGRDLHVDPTANNGNDGVAKPVRTIARAVQLAEPGDTIHLKPGVYFESADLTNKRGLPGKPITLDGHGAVLDGSEPVRASEWRAIAPGLHRRAKLYSRTDDAIVDRWFLLRDGQLNRMNRCSKGPSAPLKKVTELLPGEWTYIKEEDAFYIKIAPGQDFDAQGLRYPARSSAVIASIAGAHLTVKNITGTHVYNDGFNIHGAQRDLRFENIAAIACGDDGFSAHEDADCRINGFISINNATGLCDTGTSQTHYTNLHIRDCVGFDLYFIGLKHSVTNGLIESRAARAFWLDGHRLTDGAACELTMENVVLRRVGGGVQELRVGAGGRLIARNCTIMDLNITVTPGGVVAFHRCAIGGACDVLLFANATWRGGCNLHAFRALRADQRTFAIGAFADFQRLIGGESDSAWLNTLPTTLPAGVGANEWELAKLKTKSQDTTNAH